MALAVTSATADMGGLEAPGNSAAAMGGVSTPSNYKPVHPECIRYLSHGKFYKCHRHEGVSPGHPVGKPKPIGIGPSHPVGKPRHIAKKPGSPCDPVVWAHLEPGCEPPANPGPCASAIADCGPPCVYAKCEELQEEPLEATEMKMHLFVSKTGSESVWGCAKLRFPDKQDVEVRFLAYYGSFRSGVYGGDQGPSAAPVYCSEYVLPPHPEYVYCSTDNPRVIDTAWVVMLNRTTHTFIESERVKFYIDNPEEAVGAVHCPVG